MLPNNFIPTATLLTPKTEERIQEELNGVSEGICWGPSFLCPESKTNVKLQTEILATVPISPCFLLLSDLGSTEITAQCSYSSEKGKVQARWAGLWVRQAG